MLFESEAASGCPRTVRNFVFIANSGQKVGIKTEFGVRGDFFGYFFCGRKKVTA